jgi:hypothetical protein
MKNGTMTDVPSANQKVCLVNVVPTMLTKIKDDDLSVAENHDQSNSPRDDNIINNEWAMAAPPSTIFETF